MILIDNVLWGGSVVDSEKMDEQTKAIRAINDFVSKDERVECVMLSISDGLSLVRVK